MPAGFALDAAGANCVDDGAARQGGDVRRTDTESRAIIVIRLVGVTTSLL
ncbi:MAG: hypothetical protein R8G01_17460 [Ilumatobacteraceae bacterium]|nr:hypothetical protein [Ilumatobacteraceae bacterium]